MKTKNSLPQLHFIIGLSSLLLAARSAEAAIVFATLNSQDRIIGIRQSGGDALGYYSDTTPPQVGVSGGSNARVNQNAVIGFILPALNPGERLSAANFEITISDINTNTNYDVALFGLTETNPDDSGTSLFSQSGIDAINAAFTSTTASEGSTPFSDSTAFIQSMYLGTNPTQSEVFFRLNQTQGLGTSNTRRLTFAKDSAELRLTILTPLIWNNASTDGIWNDNSANWSHDETNVAFATNDSVVFQDTAETLESIDVVGTHAPSITTFVNSATTAFELGGTGSIGGSGSMLVQGGGDVTLANSGGVNFTGVLALSNSSRVILATAGNHGSTSIGVGSVLELQNGASVSGPISSSGTILDSSTTGTVELEGAISGSGAISKTGASTLILSGTNTYTGLTSISAGTLSITGDQSAATGDVAVSGAATRLIGTGTIGGDTTIISGAIHSAGGAIANSDKVGLQTFDQADAATTNLTYGAGSIFEWDLNAKKDADDSGARASDYDAVDVTGTLTVDSTAIFRVVLGSSATSGDFSFWQQAQTWDDIFGGGFNLFNDSGFNTNLLQVVDADGNSFNQSNLNAGYNFSVNGTTLTWSAVPEPTSALAGLLIGAGLLRRRRA